jgi:G3E family GTPase
MTRARTPITVLTGYLGAGKATLLNRNLDREQIVSGFRACLV